MKKGESWSVERRKQHERSVKKIDKMNRQASAEQKSYNRGLLYIQVYEAFVHHHALFKIVPVQKDDIELLEVWSLAACGNGGLPILKEVGHRRYFTKEEAIAFIEEHTKKMLNLRAIQLFKYIEQHQELRFTTTFSAQRGWNEKLYKRLTEAEELDAKLQNMPCRKPTANTICNLGYACDGCPYIPITIEKNIPEENDDQIIRAGVFK